MNGLGPKHRFLKFVFYIIPHHAISRVVYHLTRIQGPLVQPMIAWFVANFRVDMSEAVEPDISRYKTFNQFFTRPLKKGSRPVVAAENMLACPCDGKISEAGSIEKGAIMQAKGRTYSVTELLGGNAKLAKTFNNGQFATIYLAPNNYHRIHMPLTARVNRMIHIPGRLFSVAPWTVESIPRIFARNERLVCLLSTAAGPMAMVLVGAINVSSIETIWSGPVLPPKASKVRQFDFTKSKKGAVKGQEMGRFNMGSTVILLTSPAVKWLPPIEAGHAVKMGQPMGHFNRQKKAQG